MPSECVICGETPDVPRTCNHCSKSVCGDHLLPENHDCPALKTPSGEEWFAEEFETFGETETRQGRTSHTSTNTDTNNSTNSPAVSSPSSSRKRGVASNTIPDTDTGEKTPREKLLDAERPSKQDDTEPIDSASTSDTPRLLSRVATGAELRTRNAMRRAWIIASALLRIAGVVVVWTGAGLALWRLMAGSSGLMSIGRPAVAVAVSVGLLLLTQ